MYQATPLFSDQEASIRFLNSQEELWLAEHPQNLRVGITQIPNQVLKSKDGYRGYSIDLFEKLASKLHVKFDYIYYPTWKKVLEAGAKRDIDIVFLAQKTQSRLAIYNFTDIVLLQHNKIITNSKHSVDLDMTTLYDKKVAVVKDSALFEYIKRNFPKIKLYGTRSEIDSLNTLLHNEVEYTIAEPVRLSYYMNKNNIDSLYIAATFPYDYKLRIASRNDLPILNIILNKALEQIPQEEKKALALKWGYEKDLYFDRELLFKIIFIFIFGIFAVMYLYRLNRKLQKTQKLLNQANENLQREVAIEVEKNREKELIMLNQSRFAQMGQILDMIAHQWRQPLNNLMLVNQTLYLKCKKEPGSLSQKELDEFWNKSSLLIKEMSNTVDDFRDFFKPEKEQSIFDLNDVVSDILSIIDLLFHKYQIKVTLKTDTQCLVKGYKNETAQAILNILYNAIDAIVEKRKDGGVIFIETVCKGEQVYLSIEDNAGGISSEIIEDIFDPYFSTKENRNGTGLGLYMSKVIVEKHMNGKLLVHNTHQGAKFTISLLKAAKN